jgi:hypothetical protein
MIRFLQNKRLFQKSTQSLWFIKPNFCPLFFHGISIFCRFFCTEPLQKITVADYNRQISKLSRELFGKVPHLRPKQVWLQVLY